MLKLSYAELLEGQWGHRPLLASKGIDVAARDNQVNIIDVLERSYLNVGPRIIMSNLAIYVARLLSAEVCSDIQEEGTESCCRVYLWAPPPRHCIDKVFFTAFRGRAPSYIVGKLARLGISELSPGFYVVYRAAKPSHRVYIRVERNGVTPIPSPCPKKVLEALAAAGSEISVKDAVEVISATLGVKKAEAREVLASLAKRLCIVINSNRIVLLD